MKSLKRIGVQLGYHVFECVETREQFSISGQEMAVHFDTPHHAPPRGGYKGVIGDAHPSTKTAGKKRRA